MNILGNFIQYVFNVLWVIYKKPTQESLATTIEAQYLLM